MINGRALRRMRLSYLCRLAVLPTPLFLAVFFGIERALLGCLRRFALMSTIGGVFAASIG